MSTEPELSDVGRVLGTFVDDLGDRLSAHELETVLDGRADGLTSADLGNKPESHTESNLILPLLEAVGLEVDREPYGEAGGHGAWPDFEITNVDAAIIGESKPLNNVEEAQGEVKDYLDRKSIGAEYGIATDGIEWYVYKIELGGDFTDYPEIESVDLRPALLELAREQGHVGSAGHTEVDVEESLTAFVDLFSRDAFEELLTRTAPRRIREERKRDVEAFYDLYIELLFGQGEDVSYETCLLDDVRSPPGAEQKAEQLFAITLVNRLLFVKFLETRGVLTEGFLRERVRHYEEHGDALGGGLYETQIKPLFYGLLNTPKEERSPKHRRPGTWFTDVPYLNGGLFRESIPEEHHYSVHDRILRVVIDDLIEGSKLELNGGGFDPAIVGSVFEKTINHIEQERTQKDVGAYYTPNDVTEIVVEQAVDPKIEEVLVEPFVAHAAGDDEAARKAIRAEMKRRGLGGILRAVEDGEGWFGSPEAIRAAHERLGELTLLDPACGSGHFLTTAMDEIHRVELSLLRGLNFGGDPDPQQRYNAKVNLALNCIYGVDVDEVAAEIAKLRIWLKIVEGNGWKPRYGRLPNIDVNVTAGNSLVGLPMTGSFDDADVWTEGIQEIEERRREYKAHDGGDPRKLERFMDEEIRPALDDRYLSLFSRPVETSIESREEFEAIAECIDDGNLYASFSSIQVKRADGEAITDEQTERLDDLGFKVHTKSARMNVEEAETERKSGNYGPHFEPFVEDLGDLFDDGLYFATAERLPTTYDLEQALGKPFHWIAEFPEVAAENDGRHTIEFDVILANPPYGNLLSDSEKLLVNGYETAGLNEISFNFIERQLQLLSDGGYYGNITSQRFVYQSDAYVVHDLLRQYLENIRIASFGHRPQSIFGNAQARTSIVSGAKNSDVNAEIATSELILIEEEDREQKLADVVYSNVDQLLLRDRIGGDSRDGYEILPKVGRNEEILRTLRDTSDRILGDVRSSTETSFPNFRKRGGGYWLGFGPENEWGDLTSIKPLYYESELHQQTAFLLVNSSLFYVYWMTYSNFRNFDFGHIDKFPMPAEAVLEEYESEIYEYGEKLWNAMLESPSSKSDERFDMGGAKAVIDEIERALIADWFDLSDTAVEWLTEYHTEFGRSE